MGRIWREIREEGGNLRAEVEMYGNENIVEERLWISDVCVFVGG